MTSKGKNNAKSYDTLEGNGRVPPQSIEIEEAVLGAMLIEYEAAGIAMSLIKTADIFYKPAHRHIFEVIQDLWDEDSPMDLLTVENTLRDRNLLDSIGGPGYLSDLTRSVSSAANIDYHVEIIQEKYLKRQTILDSTDTIKKSYDIQSDVHEVLEEAAHRLDLLMNSGYNNQGMLVGDALPESLQEIDDARANPQHVTGVPSGLGIDNFTAGWQPGDLILIAARPSMGKTALALTCARNAAIAGPGYPGAVFSLEMSRSQLMRRLICMEARVNSMHVRNGRISEKEFEKIATSVAERIHKMKIIIDDTAGVDLRFIRSRARSYYRRYGIKWIMIDYLQLMNSRLKSESRNYEIEEITRGLKGLAKELGIPVIAMSQLSRSVEQRGGDKRPQLSDLRDSGAIEQDADLVMFIYRAEYYGITTDSNSQSTAGIADLIIAKQRNGPTASERHLFEKEHGEFLKLSTVSEPPEYMKNYRSPLPDEANF